MRAIHLYILTIGIFFLTGCKKSIQETAPNPSNPIDKEFSTSSYITPTASFGTCNYDLNDSTLTNAGWTKKFEDNFSTDLSKWNIWTGGAFNNELQYYRSANLTLSGGILSIAAKKETVTGVTTPWNSTLKTFNYTSGRIESKPLFSSSDTTPKVRMIARIQLPSGYGMWPAFWSYGDPWPTQGEIDILEARGQEPTTFYTSYWYGSTEGINQVSNSTATITSSVSLQTCWHVYELIWESDKLTFLFDGQVVNTKTGGYIPDMYKKKEKITLNLAVGGSFFRSLRTKQIVTGTLKVDWVKVFTSN
jgi:beta-glucanase (GH16 family)